MNFYARHTLTMTMLMVVAGAPIPALSEDEFFLAGTYTQNVACKGDGTDPKPKVVRINETEINSNFGLCTFMKKERDGQTLSAQMSCNGPCGNVLLGDVRFTLREDRNVDFVDQDNAYKAVLYRCPQSAGNTKQIPASATGAPPR